MSLSHNIPIMVATLVGVAASATASGAGIVELQAPRPPRTGETVQVQVTTGPLPRGSRLVLLTMDGMVLGTIFPFGAPQETGTVPVPAATLSDGRLRLRLQVVEPGAAPRPTRPDEIDRIDLVIVPGAE